MRMRLGRVLMFQLLLAGILAGSACNKTKNADVTAQQGSEGGGPPGMRGGPGGPGGPGGRPSGPVGEAMTKLFKGPQSLKDTIGRELNSEAPPWDNLKPQAKEFAELASSIGKYDPPRGDKESWKKLAGNFSKQAADLERAVNAKDHDAALAVHTAISDNQTCKACHDAHRGGPGGPGGFRGRGGPPGGFGGPGGPPGRPGGPPPGGKPPQPQ